MFETQIKTIVNNFLLFLNQSFQKLFAETVLSQSKNITAEDFSQTLKAMSKCRFILDHSFLALLLRQIGTTKVPDE